MALFSPGTSKRAVPGEHRVDGGGEGVHVAFHPHGLVRDLLGRRPGDGERRRPLSALSRGDTEVGQRGASEIGEQDVGGFDVAVQDAESMRRLDRATDLDADLEGSPQRQDVMPQPGPQVPRVATP